MAYLHLYDTTDTPGLSSRPSLGPGQVIQSGGGIANMFHGHPQGILSSSNERSDVYGYSYPKTDRVFGHMYEKGQSHLEDTIGRMPIKDNQLPYEFPKKEYFTDTKGTTPIDFVEIEDSPLSLSASIILTIGLFVAIAFWVKSSDIALTALFFKKEKPEAWHYMVIALILTVIIWMIMKFSKITLGVVKK